MARARRGEWVARVAGALVSAALAGGCSREEPTPPAAAPEPPAETRPLAESPQDRIGANLTFFVAEEGGMKPLAGAVVLFGQRLAGRADAVVDHVAEGKAGLYTVVDPEPGPQDVLIRVPGYPEITGVVDVPKTPEVWTGKKVPLTLALYGGTELSAPEYANLYLRIIWQAHLRAERDFVRKVFDK